MMVFRFKAQKVLKEALDLAKANNTFVAVHEEDQIKWHPWI